MTIIDKNMNQIYLDMNMGIFVGKIRDNRTHKHYALQLSIASNHQFVLTDENHKQQAYNTCFIHSNIEHQLESPEAVLIILINPISSIGHLLFHKFKNTTISNLNQDFEPLTTLFDEYIKYKIDFEQMTGAIHGFFENSKCQCEKENHVEDDRIYKAIQYLESNFERQVPLQEIANICCLSETRFLHLFKEKTKLNFRRYQLWNKLIQSLPYLKTNSITQTALQFGFTDSSHYNRTFKETFGLTPKFLSSIK